VLRTFLRNEQLVIKYGLGNVKFAKCTLKAKTSNSLPYEKLLGFNRLYPDTCVSTRHSQNLLVG